MKKGTEEVWWFTRGRDAITWQLNLAGGGQKLEFKNGKGQSLSGQTFSTRGVCKASFWGARVADPIVESCIPMQARQIWQSYLKASLLNH